MRFIVEQARTGLIQSRDLIVQEPQVVMMLSGPSNVTFKVKYGEPSGEGIDWKAYGQIVHVEETSQVTGQREIIASAITQPGEIDPETGDIVVTAKGFSCYPDKLPWLDNWNPIAVDPFEVVHRIWNHVQSYAHGNIGVTVTPAESNTLLLPGFYFDGTEFVIDFFAYFVRAADYRDCMEEINNLARDIPFDYIERSAWNNNRTAINKTLELAYPRRGVVHGDISFKIGENVIQATPSQETEIDWCSDVIVRGWFPGKVYSSSFSNADPYRFRRVIKEEDAMINSRERSAVWAKRKLTRRLVPKHWSSMVIDMYHPSAPWGSYELGDDIFIQGVMPFTGKIAEWHRIISMAPDPQTGRVELTMKHVDAFNYDMIDF